MQVVLQFDNSLTSCIWTLVTDIGHHHFHWDDIREGPKVREASVISMIAMHTTMQEWQDSCKSAVHELCNSSLTITCCLIQLVQTCDT